MDRFIHEIEHVIGVDVAILYARYYRLNYLAGYLERRDYETVYKLYANTYGWHRIKRSVFCSYLMYTDIDGVTEVKNVCR